MPTVHDASDRDCGTGLWRYRLLIAVTAAYICACVLAATGCSPSRLYSPSVVYLQQAAALWHGHLSLSSSVGDVHFDNVLYGGRVQQVWGLGVPGWLVMLSAPIGGPPIPDRLALAAALWLFLYFSGTTVLCFLKHGCSGAVGLATVIVIITSPPLWTLALYAPQGVYEDASLYALLVSLGGLVALVRVYIGSSLRAFMACCALAAISGFVRPPEGVFGAFAALAAAAALRAKGCPRRVLVGGILLVALGDGLLVLTNVVRFGSPLTFGHNATSTSMIGIVTSRFVNPIRQASLLSASRELFGAMFLADRPLSSMSDFGYGQFWGQTHLLRWRNFYVPSYDPIILLPLIAGVAFGVASMRYALKRRRLPVAARPDATSLWAILTAWGGLCVLAEFCFMMYYPGLCSRYLYDFWPGFAALLVVCFGWSVQRAPTTATVLLVALVLFEFRRADCRELRLSMKSKHEAVAEMTYSSPLRQVQSRGRWTPATLPTGSEYRGLVGFWDTESGVASCVVMVPVDNPDYVEILIGPRSEYYGNAGRQDSYRAQIDGCELKCSSIVEADDGMRRVRFEIPAKVKHRSHDHLLFLCFVAIGDGSDFASERKLDYVAWRGG